MSIFSERLESLRGDMTQRQFANKLDIPLTSYTNWVLGLRTPNMEAIEKICSRLSVSSDWLIGLSQAPPHTHSDELFREKTTGYSAKCYGCVEKEKKIAMLETQVERLERVVDKLTK